jgi:hypothetical protein
MVAYRMYPRSERARVSGRRGVEETRRGPGVLTDETGEVRARQRPVMVLEAMPVDGWASLRIDPPVDLAVECLTDDGVEAHCAIKLSPGRRVSLGFPESPFLPRPGTVARVQGCSKVAGGGGETRYRLRLVYEPACAA